MLSLRDRELIYSFLLISLVHTIDNIWRVWCFMQGFMWNENSSLRLNNYSNIRDRDWHFKLSFITQSKLHTNHLIPHAFGLALFSIDEKRNVVHCRIYNRLTMGKVSNWSFRFRVSYILLNVMSHASIAMCDWSDWSYVY